MALSKHVRLLLTVTIGWIVFVLIGLPSYYQDWPFTRLLYFCVVVFFIVGAFIYRRLTKNSTGNCLKRALEMAFYITVPFIFYDYLYIHFVREEPFELLNRFWFLSVFYIVPWIQAPLLFLFVVYEKRFGKSWLLISVFLFIVSFVLYALWATFEGSFFDVMSDYPERKVTMLGSALRFSIYGTFLTAGFLALVKFAKNYFRVLNAD